MKDPRPSTGVPLGREHLPRLAALLGNAPRPASEYCLANLYLYRARHDYRLVDGERPFLTGRTYDGANHILPFCPLDEHAAAILLGSADCIYPLAEDEARRLTASGRFCCDFRPEDSDYIYDTDSLAELAGAKSKRTQAAAFGRLEPRLTSFDAGAARAVLAEWIIDAARGADHADAHECLEAIACRNELGLSGVAVFVENDPVAFLLAGPLRGADRVVHFAKGRRSLAGAYPWMFAGFARIAGARLLNFEQDLGNAGLARAKRALAPVAILPKYRLRMRQ